VEGAKVEFIALLQARFGQKYHDLELTEFSSKCLTSASSESDRFLARSLRVHRDFLLKILCRFFQRELAERQFHIYFHPERAQPHEIVNNLARVRAVIEQTILQHHFLGVKTNPFVGPRVIIMPPNWVFVLPGKAKLEIMSWNSFVDNDRPRILCSGAPEVTKVP